MGKAILVTGGARSGKSTFAERLAGDIGGKIMYIATAVPFDDEMRDRIKKHKDSRPDTWITYEGYRGIGKAILENSCTVEGILLDCITVMVTNLLLDYLGLENESPSSEELYEAEKSILKEFEDLREAVLKVDSTIIMVTNELGSGIVPEYPLARGFRDIAGRVNQYIASWSKEVYLTVCGIPVRVK
ncbi:MAG: bifunctional adenosylcobinamide kinase/adenosylcobinamide-phosphate guanylyltransferase [Bacillota bacterium]